MSWQPSIQQIENTRQLSSCGDMACVQIVPAKARGINPVLAHANADTAAIEMLAEILVNKNTDPQKFPSIVFNYSTYYYACVPLEETS